LEYTITNLLDPKKTGISGLALQLVILFHGVNLKFRVFWDVAPCSHVEVEDSKLHNRRREGLKSHIVNLYGQATLRCFRRFTSFRVKKTKVSFNMTALPCIPEDSKLHIRHRENQKYHGFILSNVHKLYRVESTWEDNQEFMIWKEMSVSGES
jgi:hypothetical protein